LIDAKWNSKTFIKYVFRFFEPFRSRLTSKFAKSANMTQKMFVSNYFDMGIKNAQFDAKFESDEKVAKKLHEESYRAEKFFTQH
jgi:hypothetical protein